jgi:hypothetical protein
VQVSPKRERPTDADADAEESATVRAAADELYAADPDTFLDVRTRLAGQARADGNAADAKRIAALRKPTVAAWIVNRHALADPGAVQRLLDLHERLLDAQTELDAAALRELTGERRSLVDELAGAALDDAGRSQPPTALRDDVVATFDAALADPEIAGRLGRLIRAEHWSGFGVAASELPPGAPALRLLSGGRSQPDRGTGRAAAKPAAQSGTTQRPSGEKQRPTDKKQADAEKREAADRRRRLKSARAELDRVESELATTQSDEETVRDRVRTLTSDLTRVQRELSAAKARAEELRKAATKLRNQRREARAALDRAERADGRS